MFLLDKITKIPLDVVEIDGYHILIDVDFNTSHSGSLIVDTGASHTVLSRNIPEVEEFINEISFDEFAAQTSTNFRMSSSFTPEELADMGMKNEKVVSLAANNAPVDMQFARINKMQIGDLVMRDIPVGYIDICNVNKLYKKLGKPNVGGLLGSDLLVKYGATINFEKKLLTLKL